MHEDRSGGERTYLTRRRRRRLLWLAAAVAAVAIVVLTARRPDLDDPCAAPRAAPSSELQLMPAALSLDGIATVTNVERDDPNITMEAVTTTPLEELTVQIQDAVVAAGYRFAGMDSEPAEAEVFFTRGMYAGGQARIAQSPCAGRWDVELVLLDPDEVPS